MQRIINICTITFFILLFSIFTSSHFFKVYAECDEGGLIHRNFGKEVFEGKELKRILKGKLPNDEYRQDKLDRINYCFGELTIDTTSIKKLTLKWVNCEHRDSRGLEYTSFTLTVDELILIRANDIEETYDCWSLPPMK